MMHFWGIALVCFLNLFRQTICKEVLIKEANFQLLFKTTYLLSGFGLQWRDSEESKDGVETCSNGQDAEIWLLTRTVQKSGNQIIHNVQIHIEIEAQFKKCKAVQEVDCFMDGFELYRYIGDGYPDFPFNSQNLNSYEEKQKARQYFKSNFTYLGNITGNATIRERVNTTITLNLREFRSITFGIKSRGACGELKRMKVYYYACEEKFIQSVMLKETIAPRNGTKTVLGNCSLNSRSETNMDNLTAYNCHSNGMWSAKVDGELCKCDKGYQPTDHGCSSCQPDRYKPSISNDNCTMCPPNTISAKNNTTCKCKEGYFSEQKTGTPRICHALPVVKKIIPKSIVNGVNISWIMPDNSLGGPFLYDVECFICNQTVCCNISCTNEEYDPRQKDLNQTWVIVSNLTYPKKYAFRVYSRNILNAAVAKTEWNYTETASCVEILPAGSFVRFYTSKPKHEKDSNLLLYIIIGVGILLLLILIAFLIIFLLRGRKVRQFRRSQRLRINQDLPLGERNYIDPTTYDDPERAVLEFTKELDRSVIKFEAIIGGGEFGDVYKGEINLHGQPATKVAIKTLKSGATHKNRTDFLLEASVMGQFKNLNVIALEGVVTKSTPFLIVIEYMENGSLDKYLKHNDGMLKPLQLLGMARGVASGMHYLAGIHFVHRDLAARNVLVNANKCCKVADFGLSRDIGQNQDSEYESQGGKIPVRWTAPEAITYRKFSTASDIWSYGILLWEIMSFAERPYWNWGNEEVMKRVDQQGYRLPPPMNCPKIVHQLMEECWLIDRTKRPPFNEIVRILDEWIKYPEKLNKDYIKVRRNELLGYSTFTSVKEWLDAIKMGMYASNFSKAGYDELSDVAVLTEDELLKKVGVRLLGHRRKIYQRIKEMSEELKLQREPSVRI